MKQIVTEFKIGSKGVEAKITTSGFKGSACLDATRNLEAALGRVVDSQPTEEMYQTESQSETENAR